KGRLCEKKCDTGGWASLPIIFFNVIICFNAIARAPLFKFRVFGALSCEIASMAPFEKTCDAVGWAPLPLFFQWCLNVRAPLFIFKFSAPFYVNERQWRPFQINV